MCESRGLPRVTAQRRVKANKLSGLKKFPCHDRVGAKTLHEVHIVVEVSRRLGNYLPQRRIWGPQWFCACLDVPTVGSFLDVADQRVRAF
ncbi:hypothetical protein DBZ45_04775 [Arthrobacter globiformis]|uniref:Uncharacterized protein n=1 Tax=Arthrobacter globiformis TaxID=1665 RepID=A0A328HIB6_ARTGO|nr:hypothetical protein DBZ45_04775 [Arthrobacter globiformis]